MSENEKSEFKIVVGPHARTYLLYLTTAPEAYDGFGTFTFADDRSVMTEYAMDMVFGGGVVLPPSEKRFRIVAILQENVEWQKGRNMSGMHSMVQLTLEPEDVEHVIMQRLAAPSGR